MMDRKLRKTIKELEQYLHTSRPAPANSIVDAYNEFKRELTKRPYTSCGSCLRRYLTEMVNAVKMEDKARTAKAQEARLKKKNEAASSQKDCQDDNGI